MSLLPKKYIVSGDSNSDHRGIVRYVNQFNLDSIKRFYTITHHQIDFARAWQGHKYESKYFHVVKGSFLINWIKVDSWTLPSKNLNIQAIILIETEPEILVIPQGHVTGLKALIPDSTLVIFSDATLEASQSDDYRYDNNYWDMVTP
jgi:dTDP-4-dehydrorhamnose 3,5-epimerase-like enzyme